MKEQINKEKTLGMINIISLKNAIESLRESDSNSIPVVKLCDFYLGKFENGFNEVQLYENFMDELSNIAVSDAAKKTFNELTESISAHSRDLELSKSIIELGNTSCAFVAPVFESLVVEYLINKCDDTRNAVVERMSLFDNVAAVKSILENLSYDEYDVKQGKTLVNVALKEEFATPEAKTYSQEDVDAIVAAKIDEAKLAEEAASAAKVHKTAADIESHIGLNTIIRNILKECKTEKLKVVCEQYLQALNQGRAEELLYESFVSSVSPWNYLSAVDTQLSALADRVSKYKQDIDLKKILETMKTTSSYYIVPLIEELVADYVENKTIQNRVVLRNRLTPFEYDPFVRDIISVMNDDLSLENNVYLGESVENVNNHVHTEEVYSPVKYIKENECVFNVKGTYYVKKGNNITKLKDMSAIDESFKAVCNILNSSAVVVSRELNSISLYDGNDKVVINESEISFNGTTITSDELKDLYESTLKMGDDKAVFYDACVRINEAFNDIAYIDFVKRVASNDNARRAVDVFKVKSNIFINTLDENLGTATFYKNVNPIQCCSIINEHMELNIASLFEDEFDTNEAVKKLNDKDAKFCKCIEDLKDQRETLLSMKEEGADIDDIDAAIALVDQEIKDTEDEYKDFQKEKEKFLKGDKDAAEDDLKNEVPDFDDEKKDKKDDKDDKDDELKDPEGDELLSDETAQDMEQPIDTFDGEYVDAPEFDGTFDVPADGESFTVEKISYHRNVKTGKVESQGEAILLIPMVDANGGVHDDIKKVTFMLDTDRRPIINNEYMPLDMYQAIVAAVAAAPETKSVAVASEPEAITAAEPDELPASEDIPATEELPDADEQTTDEFIDAAIADDAADDASAEAADDASLVADVERETPAETEKGDELPSYPIELGIDTDDIKPITDKEFECALDKFGIKHSKVEGVDGGICVCVGNKAEAHALRNYFKEWKNFSPAEFDSFFPELKRCFDNNSSTIPVMAESFRNSIEIMLPATEDYCKMFGLEKEDKLDQIQIVTESEDENLAVYGKIYNYAKKVNEALDQDAVDFLEKYSPIYESEFLEKNTYSLNIPYNNTLEGKLRGRGFDVKINEGEMTLTVSSTDVTKAKKLLESFYKDAAPVSVKDFFQFADESLNESLTITFKTSDGKTAEVTLDGDLKLGAEGGDSSAAEDSADFDSSFENVTFDPKESLAFNDTEDDADEDEDDKDESKPESSEDESEKKDDAAEEENPAENGEESAEESEEKESEEKESEEGADEKKADAEDEKKDKKARRFKLHVGGTKKKETESNESVKPAPAKPLNESAQATVLDYVKCSDGKRGQIICQMANGDFIVNVEGHTRQCPRGTVTMINERPDTLECPYKFDPATLKGLYEQMVECGIFINGMQITPKQTYVKYSEYVAAKDNDDIRIIIEGESTLASRKYIRITEDVNDFANVNDYMPGFSSEEAELLGEPDILVNRRDYATATGDATPVRCLVKDDNGEYCLTNIAFGLCRIQTSDQM